jgi:hypothetical protein
MIDKIDGPLSKLNNAISATNTFLDATTQKQAAELLSLQESVKQQVELVKTITDASEKANLAANPRNLADAAWPPLPAAKNAPLNLGSPAFMAPCGATHADPKVTQHVALATVKTRLTLTDFLLHQVQSDFRSSGVVVQVANSGI